MENHSVCENEDWMKVAYFQVMSMSHLIQADQDTMHSIVKKNWKNLDILLTSFNKESKQKHQQEYKYRIYEMIINIFKQHKLGCLEKSP